MANEDRRAPYESIMEKRLEYHIQEVRRIPVHLVLNDLLWPQCREAFFVMMNKQHIKRTTELTDRMVRSLEGFRQIKDAEPDVCDSSRCGLYSIFFSTG